MDSRIERSAAQERVEADEYCHIVGNFLVRHDDPADDFSASVWLINGCKCTIREVARILREQFPSSSHVGIRDEPWLDVMHIDLEWSEMEFQWDNHNQEFQERVINTLSDLSAF